MKKKGIIPIIIGSAVFLIAAILLSVHCIKVVNAMKISEMFGQGRVSEAEAMIEKHPGCLNTQPAFAPPWLAVFMDFPQSDYLLPDACTMGYYDTARRMVELGADPNKGLFLTSLGSTLQGKHAGCYDMAVWLYEHGASADLVSDKYYGYSAMWAIASSASTEECTEEEVVRLFDYFYDRIGDKVDNWAGILILSSASEHTGMIEVILDKGLCDVNACDSNGSTALMTAALWGRAETVRLLLDRGADSALTDKNGLTAKDWAEKYSGDCSEILELLNQS